jgi:uncharacterized iron-regulated membrane protein
MKRAFELGGYATAVVLVAFGIGALAISLNGRSEVRDNVARENIVGSPDMTPDAIREEAEKAGLSEEILNTLPTCDVAGKEISTGAEAKCFAQYMRIHGLEATGGRTYSEMGRYLTADGKDTNDSEAAAKDPKTGRPVENAARNLWVTETALATALNVAYFAEQVSIFGLVVAIALILAGIGFAILAFSAFRWLPRRGQ